MRTAWDRFARNDPMFHIHCGDDDWDPTAFFATGIRDVEEWMAWTEDDVSAGRMLEIGCGLGRMTVAFANTFDHVDGVDVSVSMIEQARELGPPSNVRYHVVSGGGLEDFEDDAYDFVGSGIVFQHIPDESAIATYMQEIARVLHPGGHALLQFNTVPFSFARRLAYMLPDSLLPRTSRRYMRCYRRKSERIREVISAARLTILWERAPDSTFHYFFLQKPDSHAD